MKKNHYRVYLYSNEITVKEMALMAVKSNGSEGKAKASLPVIKGYFDAEKFRYPNANDGMECHLIGENNLTVDLTKGDNTTCILCIERIELLELNPVLAYAESEN